MGLKLRHFASGLSLMALCAGGAQAQFVGTLASPSAQPSSAIAPSGLAPSGSTSSVQIGPSVAPSAAPVRIGPQAAPAPSAAAPFIGSVAAAPASRPIIRASVTAVVNDEPITSFDVTQRVIWFVVTTGVQPSEQNIRQLQSEAIDALIDEHLQAQELRRRAHERKLDDDALFVSDEEIDDYLDAIAGENRLNRDQFMSQMKSRGLTERSVRDQLRIQLSWRDFIRRYYGSRIRVGDDQVKQTIERISAEASKPSFLVSEIFIDASRTGGLENAKASAAQRMQQLQQGARFEAVARQFSSVPSAAKGGDAGWLGTGEVRPEVAVALAGMQTGQVRMVPVNDGVYLLLLREKKAGGATSTMVTLKQAAVPLPAGADQKAADAANARLAQVRTRATNCSNLDAAAQAAGLEADDLGEADMVTLAPAFREAVQNLQPGQISAPVRSAQGLHLLAVCAKRSAGGDVPTKQEVQNRLMVEQVTMLQRRSLRDLRQSATINQPQ